MMPAVHRRRLRTVLAPLFELTVIDRRLEGVVIGTVDAEAGRLPITRFIYRGPSADLPPLRLGLFAVVHGDEPAAAETILQLLCAVVQSPEIARGFELFCYPVCNPTGFEAGTRHNHAGADLNREFWRGSAHPEVRALEAELRSHGFDGVVALHADGDSHGLYAFARGAVIVHELVEPALAAAEAVCSRNCDVTIDGFHAENGVIRDWYPGVLGPPADQSPAPFEIVLETPGQRPVSEQAEAAFKAVRGLIAAMPRLQAVGAGI